MWLYIIHFILCFYSVKSKRTKCYSIYFFKWNFSRLSIEYTAMEDIDEIDNMANDIVSPCILNLMIMQIF